MSGYVLVHGGAHGGWFWDDTAAQLRARGHHVRTFDLPGRDGNTNVTLDDYVARIGEEVDAAFQETREVPVLVAHSVGGVSASQFAERRPESIRSMIYVGAVVPTDGQSGMDRMGEAGAECVLLREGAMIPSEDGSSMTVNPAFAPEAFYGLTSPAVIAAALPRLCPEPLAPVTTPVSLGENFASVSKAWIAGTEDRTMPFALQQAHAAACGAVLTAVVSDHSTNYSAAGEFVDLLERLA